MDPQLSELIARIREAAAHGSPLRIRGGGTKDFYGEQPEGELLETRSLSGIVAYEPSELVVTVRAGTPLAELEASLAASGQCLPFEPPHFGPEATVGGMVAAGLSGPARASVGSVRDYVLGLHLVNGKAEHLVFGGQVMKNVAGYDVSRLMVGAMGTLGLITQVSLKVLGRPTAEATLRFGMSQGQALKQLNEWGGRPLPLNASRWHDDVLHVRLRGAVAAVDAACASMGGERVDEVIAAREWNQCREQQLPWFDDPVEHELWRLSAPQTAPELPLSWPTLIEWHGAQRWVRAEVGQGEAMRAIVARAGGHATLFDSPRPATGRFHPLAPPIAHIHRELKRQFDPALIFNRGRQYPDI